MDELLDVIREFHEQPSEIKKEWYSRDPKKVRFYCNGDLFLAKAANWRDTISFDFQDGPLSPHSYPLVCRVILGDQELNQQHKSTSHSPPSLPPSIVHHDGQINTTTMELQPQASSSHLLSNASSPHLTS
ncbi:hypothetical protein PIB30_057048 [Stylosanthes scabra]|uniref:Uncharacterized protein n=1 Tax=Stylosanthes scabra TaxID=79078 RepID=A0ABU6XHG9_9FABA|nr:hypothetical protein [Stylosanthes scabra]